jgi:hypothetical protein
MDDDSIVKRLIYCSSGYYLERKDLEEPKGTWRKTIKTEMT